MINTKKLKNYSIVFLFYIIIFSVVHFPCVGCEVPQEKGIRLPSTPVINNESFYNDLPTVSASREDYYSSEGISESELVLEIPIIQKIDRRTTVHQERLIANNNDTKLERFNGSTNLLGTLNEKDKGLIQVQAKLCVRDEAHNSETHTIITSEGQS